MKCKCWLCFQTDQSLSFCFENWEPFWSEVAASRFPEAVCKKMMQIGTSSLDSVPENYYRIVADRLSDGLKNQVGRSKGVDLRTRALVVLWSIQMQWIRSLKYKMIISQGLIALYLTCKHTCERQAFHSAEQIHRIHQQGWQIGQAIGITVEVSVTGTSLQCSLPHESDYLVAWKHKQPTHENESPVTRRFQHVTLPWFWTTTPTRKGWRTPKKNNPTSEDT